MMFQPWMAVVFFGTVVAVAVGLALYADRKRREALQQVAVNLGLTFYPKDPGVLMSGPGALRLFHHGHGRKARNVMMGRIEDLEVSVFDYQYTTGSGKSARTHRQTVAAVGLSGRPLPGFELRPENIFHKIGSMMGFRDIDFQGHPVFSSHFLLRGRDEQAIRAAFTPEAIAFLERSPGLCVEAGGNWVIVYRAGRRLKPDLIGGLLEEAFSISTSLV